MIVCPATSPPRALQRWAAAALLLLATLLGSAQTAAAQVGPNVPAPPPLGAVLLQDPLTAPGMVQVGRCPNPATSMEFVPDGYLMSVGGPCSDLALSARLSYRVLGLDVPDGEVRFDLRSAGGAGRSLFRVWFRDHGLGRDGYYVELEPGPGALRLGKYVNDELITMVGRTDLAGRIGSGGWFNLAVRAAGPSLWVLLDDEVVLAVADPSLDAGGIVFELERTGDLLDPDPAAVLLRDLRVTALADAGPERAPVLHPAPAVGAVVLDDPLREPRTLSASACPTGRNAREFVPDGYLLRVNGRCTASSTTAGVGTSAERLVVPDGEVRFQVRFVSGVERARFRVWVRDQIDQSGGYFLLLEPARGYAQLRRSGDDPDSLLGARPDLAASLSPTDWNTVAVRLDGPHLWVWINDELILIVTDPVFAVGGVGFQLNRLGDPDDDFETAVVLRDLRVSALEGRDPSRGPLLGPRPPPTTRRPPTAIAVPPRILQIYFSPVADRNRRAANDRGAFAAGGGPIYAYVDYFNVFLPNTIGWYWAWGNAPQQRLAEQAPFGPERPSGSLEASYDPGPRTGTLYLVILVNGLEVDSRSLVVE